MSDVHDDSDDSNNDAIVEDDELPIPSPASTDSLFYNTQEMEDDDEEVFVDDDDEVIFGIDNSFDYDFVENDHDSNSESVSSFSDDSEDSVRFASSNDSINSVSTVWHGPNTSNGPFRPITRSTLRIIDEHSDRIIELSTQPETPQSDNQQSDNQQSDNQQNDNQSDGQENEGVEPPMKCARLELEVEVPDGQTCPICFDPWTSSGEHRLASLKCGHLFGSSCIIRWLKPRENRVCPTCKSKASEKDIRYIYARCVSFVDNTEVEAVKSELEKIKTAKNGIELELKCLLSTQETQRNKINELKATIDSLMKSKASIVSNKITKKWYFSLEKNLELSKLGECRVFAYNKRRNTLIISQLNTNSIFSGCNIKEMDCETYNIGKTTCLHQKEIRGITCSDHHNLIMTVSLDKTIKMLSADSGQENMCIPTDLPLWCCNWDVSDPNRICVGGLSGNILLYDIRQTKACLSRVHDIRDVSPVISLASMSDNVISCSLNSVQIHRKNGSGNFISENQGIVGPFYDMNYDFSNKSLVLSLRPTVPLPYCRHNVFTYDFMLQRTVGEAEKNFRGADKLTQMTKSSQFCIGGDQLFSSYNETGESINIWNIGNEKKASSLLCRDLIIDTCSWKYGSNMFLSALSNNKVKVYKLCTDES